MAGEEGAVWGPAMEAKLLREKDGMMSSKVSQQRRGEADLGIQGHEACKAGGQSIIWSIIRAYLDSAIKWLKHMWSSTVS
jgi:hypothetical protein